MTSFSFVSSPIPSHCIYFVELWLKFVQIEWRKESTWSDQCSSQKFITLWLNSSCFVVTEELNGYICVFCKPWRKGKIHSETSLRSGSIRLLATVSFITAHRLIILRISKSYHCRTLNFKRPVASVRQKNSAFLFHIHKMSQPDGGTASPRDIESILWKRRFLQINGVTEGKGVHLKMWWSSRQNFSVLGQLWHEHCAVCPRLRDQPAGLRAPPSFGQQGTRAAGLGPPWQWRQPIGAEPSLSDLPSSHCAGY